MLSYFTKFFKLYFSDLLRSSHRRCSIKKGILRNFAKFIGKHCVKVSYLIKLQPSACFIKKRGSGTGVFL